MWHEITNENDLKSFMGMHDSFHDSCIKELKYISGAYVDNDLSMYPINDRRSLKIIIQRQSEKSAVIEIEFIGLKYLKLFPVDENYTCEMLDVTMLLKNDSVYWCDCGGMTEYDIDNYKGTVICHRGLGGEYWIIV